MNRRDPPLCGPLGPATGLGAETPRRGTWIYGEILNAPLSPSGLDADGGCAGRVDVGIGMTIGCRPDRLARSN
jgi:hypothetical protein